MGNVLVDYAKGRFIEKATLPLGTDSLIAVLLQATGLPTDTVLKRNQFLSGVFTAGGTESTFTNYSRQSFTGASITITVNTSTDVVTLDTSNVVINSAGGALNNSVAKLLLCYKPTSATADSAIPVLTTHDCVITTTGGNLTVTIPSIGTAT